MSPVDRLHRRAPEPLPLTLLTGFLGAGKTTLLNTLVRAPAMAKAVVIINELGDVPIDHLLVEKSDDALLTLSSGCLCCTLRGDLVTTLEDLLRRRDNDRIAPFDRIVIETTGLADPAPILNVVALHPYLMLRFRIDGVITVVDALHGGATLDEHRESVAQAAMADVLVITKTDLATTAALHALRDRLDALNPLAERVLAGTPEAAVGPLLAASLVRRAGRPERDGLDPSDRAPGDHHDHDGHDHDGHPHGPHEDDVASMVLLADRPLAPVAAEMMLDLLRATHGASLLRVKGLLALTDDPDRPLLVQAVQQTLHPARRLPGWPDGDRRSRLVVIGRTLDEAAIRRLWAAVAEGPAIDRPDAAALAASRDRAGSGLF